MHDASLRAHWPGILVEWSHEIEFQLQRCPRVPFANCRENRTAKCGIEQGRGEPCVHRSNGIVVAEFRHTLKDGAALFGFNQVKAHELADRWIWHPAVDDRLQELKAVVRFENIGRDYAVGLGAHSAPASLPCPFSPHSEFAAEKPVKGCRLLS